MYANAWPAALIEFIFSGVPPDQLLLLSRLSSDVPGGVGAFVTVR
jgi:hypothetical protein